MTGRAAATLAALALGGCGSAGHAGAAPDGRRVYLSAHCGTCHTLRAAGTHATRDGPDFDTSELLDRAQIRQQLDAGVGGMPSYRGRLTPAQETAVSDFLYRAMHARPRR
jgi:mono/diheme cytochrome c family protein